MSDQMNKDLILRYVLPDNWSETEKEAKPIIAKEIIEAIKNGKKIEIINAVINGQFILRDINVESEITIERTKIKEIIDWSYSTFKGVLSLKNSIFENDAIFIETVLEKDIFLDGAIFQGKAEFSDLTAVGNFYSRFYRRPTTFEEEALFNGTTFKKSIDFSHSIFRGEANFESVRIGGDAEFTQTKFKQLARFNEAQIDGNVLFNGARFNQRAIFNGAQIEEALINSVNTIFCDEASFVSSVSSLALKILGRILLCILVFVTIFFIAAFTSSIGLWIAEKIGEVFSGMLGGFLAVRGIIYCIKTHEFEEKWSINFISMIIIGIISGLIIGTLSFENNSNIAAIGTPAIFVSILWAICGIVQFEQSKSVPVSNDANSYAD